MNKVLMEKFANIARWRDKKAHFYDLNFEFLLYIFRYFPRDSQPFHTVIYKSSDVVHPSEQLESSCKSHELHLKHKEDLHTKNKVPHISIHRIF